MIQRIVKYIMISLLMVFPLISYAQNDNSFLREDFDNLDNWKPLEFPKIKRHSSYKLESDGDERYLKAESDSSASGLIYKKEFNVYEFPNIKWRWKIENVYKKGDAKTKEGDDYPIRIYIIFKYNPKKAGFLERMKYNAAKLIYGEYPPHSGLNYIWANKEYTERIITSSYTGQAKMILLQKGGANAGKWKTESVNIIEDYRSAFGEDPPAISSIAIMNDSDNTGEKAVSYVDYIEVYK
ncbi:MAG: DUF3047 domain-containing protein [Nitrospirota bacterium]